MKLRKNKFDNRSLLDQQLEDYAATVKAESQPARASDNKKWLKYGAAASTALAVSGMAEAEVIHVTQNKMINWVQGSTVTTGVDVDNNGVNDFVVQGSDFLSTFVGTFRHAGAELNGLGGNGLMTTGGGLVSKLASGATIGPAQLFGGGGNYNLLHQDTGTLNTLTGQFLGSMTGFAGARFDRNGNTHFGWIRLHVGTDANGFPNSVTIFDSAFENVPGVGLLAGQTSSVPIPEPSSALVFGLSMLALGAYGVRRNRKRRQAAKEASEDAATSA